MNFDLSQVPFSRYGSDFAISALPAQAWREGGLYLRSVRGGAPRREVLRLELLLEGQAVTPAATAEPWRLALASGRGTADACFAEPNLMRIRARGAGVRLAMDADLYGYAMPAGNGWEVNSFQARKKIRITPLQGRLEVDAPWHGMRAEHIRIDLLPDEAGMCECAIEGYDSTWQRRGYERPFEACVEAVKSEFQRWLEETLETPARYAAARELAAYVNWSSVVAPSGYLTRPAMLMSKNWMTNVWSWDHCFNAMALVRKNPALAWDQLMLMVDNQDAFGAFPDSVNAAEAVWNFCKPPIHGWALRHMLQHSTWITPHRLEEIYAPLCRWTEWWFAWRDDDGDGIPQYHHGNDSGWDNCTAFEVGPPVEGADLSAYLVLQMAALAEVARMIGRADEALAWKKRADDLAQRLIAHSWRGDRFVAPRSGDHAVYESDTLFHFLPLVLGQRLPVEVRTRLAAGLKEPGRFLTEFGLATESVRSPHYEADGYWRGPIWAPATMILIDGLAAAGEVAFARELARRFCELVAASGMAENFDALSGAGLRDRAYTWTSSVFLLLAHDYLIRK